MHPDIAVARPMRLLDLRFNREQIITAIVTLVAMAALHLLLTHSRLGRAMRAVADNPGLADLKGIDAVLVGRVVAFVGMGLVGVGGMLFGLGTSIDPLTGFRFILPIFAAAVVGGLGSIPGAVLGAMIVGIGEEMSALVLEPVYKSAVGFFAIVIVLTFRPRGLLGERAY